VPVNRSISVNDRTPGALSFQAHEGGHGLESLVPEWMTLLRSMPEARFNHFPGWYQAYLKSLAPDADCVWFVAARRAGELVGIMPLQFQDYRAGPFRTRIVGTIEDGQMQLSDFIFRRCPQSADLLYELTRWLRTKHRRRWSELRLRKVAADSGIAYAAHHRLPSGTMTQSHDRSAHIVTDCSYEQAMQAVTSKFKSNLRRRNRIAHESALLRLQSYRLSGELPGAFETFLDIESSGWKGQGGASGAIRCRPQLLAFYRTLAEEFGSSGACVINLLWHGEQPVAGQFCLLIGRTLNILKVAFDEVHRKFAPGLLLFERVLRQACEDRAIGVVHLLNAPEWARSFRPVTQDMWSYCAPAWTPLGILVHIGLWAKRRWGITVTSDGALSVGNQSGTHRPAATFWEG
jgi:CelD/BcsL family acetyltransferase involved in cellulose biosynthesis